MAWRLLAASCQPSCAQDPHLHEAVRFRISVLVEIELKKIDDIWAAPMVASRWRARFAPTAMEWGDRSNKKLDGWLVGYWRELASRGKR